MKVVIADDEYLVANMPADAFEDAGHDVRIAEHGLAALEIIRADPLDVLITGFTMPLDDRPGVGTVSQNR
jgi:DNA-binding response OmpR family regulator